VQIVIAVTIAFAVFLVVFSRDYIAPYGTPAGQVALAVVVGIFGAAFAWMRKLSEQQPVAAFLARPGAATDPADARLLATLVDADQGPAMRVVIR
jgi:hypothetical protein